jgi:hypothetical protein
MPENHYLLAEFKNEVELERTEIHQSEAEQMSNSVNWLEKEGGLLDAQEGRPSRPVAGAFSVAPAGARPYSGRT